MSTYIHKTDRRLRIRSDYVLNNPAEVQGLVEQLRQIDAVLEVRHRRYAGSVTLIFDHNELTADDLLETVESHGWLRSDSRSAFVENAVRSGSRSLVKGVAVLALKRLMGPTVVKALAFA
ncbi:hypothetical protein [Ferrimonas sp. YFM]|uniref:hypothetical protein n=1 Tax=Ferrimonas sp. YFM TaxID=3028878 RepID=UPI0025740E58|nr:hypothetical protein [Ferrimonas sp. YFM]BDY03793.1 hypothetical protein F0521_08340 [Ferrimonas sp. YFM]